MRIFHEEISLIGLFCTLLNSILPRNKTPDLKSVKKS